MGGVISLGETSILRPMPTPEDHAREHIDQALEQAGWKVQDYKSANLHAGRGVVLRNFPLVSGHGFADYLLYVDGKAAGIIEAKKEGVTLIGVEVQAEKYSKGLPTDLPAHIRPLPFLYQSTGVETRFTNGLDPQPRSRPVFSFHRPETLTALIPEHSEASKNLYDGSLAAEAATTLRARLKTLPPLSTTGLWPAQITAINNLEKSLAQDRPRALIQMATGSGKTFTAINFIYRLIKFGGARRVLFLVDRGNLGDQTLKEFQQYVSPYNNFKFTEEFIVQRLAGNTLDTTARVCISTIQRMYSMLKGRELSDEDEEASVSGLERLFKQPDPIDYNPAIPIETFDVIVTDECHRSIYNLWAQVLEYFDAHLIGLTATPNKQTFGFFNQNLVMEYSHEQAVADGVNVNYDVYLIRTAITTAGSKVDAGFFVEKRDRETRATRWEQLSDDFTYDPDQLDRDVVAPDQIRTIVKAFQSTARLCAMNLMLHGIGSDKDLPIVVADSLAADPGDRFDIVMTNPPFGKKSSTTIVGEEGQVSKERDIVERDDFWATTSNKQLNFVQHVKTLLKQNGRAAVVVPDNVLFEGGAGETVRRKLLHECDVHTLLRLPTGLFYAQGVKANVLFFDKKPASETPWTRKLWIYDLRTNQHFTLKTDPLKREDLDEFVKCYNPTNRHTRKATWSDKKPDGRWRAYDYDELMARDKASLDIFWLKDDSLEDSANLPNPDIIAQEIVDDLEAALEQFRLIANDLSGDTSEKVT
jgi:hypothetical protein